MSSEIEVVSVNISEEKGTVKKPVDRISVDERGVVEDAHAGLWHRQVSLLAMEQIERFAKVLGRDLDSGEFAENITIRGLDLGEVAILDRMTFGGVELEVSQIGKECHGDGCAIFREVGKCVMPKEGIFLRVVSGGTVQPGDEVTWSPRPLRIKVITLSDRASRGEYTDRSGPRVETMLAEHFGATQWHLEADRIVLPDDVDALTRELTQARAEGIDVVITTGGTGVGPRDITPDVVTGLADKEIPGVMEAIRLKFGEKKPRALLSRGVAAVLGGTLVYTLPGSVRAVNEYMGEILKTMEHLIYMLHELDIH